MRNAVRTVGTASALVFALSIPAQAQDVSMPLAAKDSQPQYVLQIEYDEFEDVTTVMTGFIPGPDFYVGLFYTCQGQGKCKPDEKPYLAFYQRGRTWKYLENSGLIFLLNGNERLDMGQIAHHGEVQTGGGVAELMGVPVSVSTLKRIATAKTAEYRLGTTETRLSSRQKSVIKEGLQEIYRDWKPDEKQ